MKYSLTTSNLSLSVTDLRVIDKKLGRLDKLLFLPCKARLVLRRDSHHQRGQVISCRLSIYYCRQLFHVKQTSDNIESALDQAISALKKEIAKHKTKIKKKR